MKFNIIYIYIYVGGILSNHIKGALYLHVREKLELYKFVKKQLGERTWKRLSRTLAIGVNEKYAITLSSIVVIC